MVQEGGLDAIPLELDGDRQEIIDGELVVTPSPMPKHQIVSRSIFRRLDQHVVANDLGEVFYAPIDIRFTPDNVLIPDIVFVAKERLHITLHHLGDYPGFRSDVVAQATVAASSLSAATTVIAPTRSP